MKMQELNSVELQEVNGGNHSSSSESSFFGSFDISSLFSYESSNQNRNRNSSSSFTFGNGISSGFGGMFGRSSN